MNEPFENPDGAANHYEFHKLQPTYILHAGYWSAVARDVARARGETPASTGVRPPRW